MLGALTICGLSVGEARAHPHLWIDAAATVLWALAFWLYRADWIALLALIPAAAHLAWQVATLDPADPANPLARFRSNRWTGALMAAACFVVGNA